MHITELIEQYLSERDASSQYQWFLRRTARLLEAAGVVDASDLEPVAVNRWLASLRGLSAVTRANYRRGSLVIWHYAHRLGLAKHPSRRVVRVKQKFQAPVAWSMDDLSRLLAACRDTTGTMKSGCPHSVFFTAWVLAGYELGIRRADLHNLRADQVRGNRVYVTQSKTGIALGKQVSDECADALAEMVARSTDGTVFHWAIGTKWLSKHFKAIAKSAGLRGTTKFLRRSGATHCEIAQPGSAGKFLGHLTPGLAYRFYVDPTLASGDMPRPPAITSRTG